MKVERFEDLIDWTREAHAHLARCMTSCADRQAETRAKWLLIYLADHEKALSQTIARIAAHADAKAMHTWICDFLARAPMQLGQKCKAYHHMDIEAISADVFDMHNQILDLYRSLARRAEIDGARTLAEDLLELEQHETMRMAQQVNRVHEM